MTDDGTGAGTWRPIESSSRSPRRGRVRTRYSVLKFLLTWIALLGLLGAMLSLTGDVNVGFIASAGPYIVQGAGSRS